MKKIGADDPKHVEIFETIVRHLRLSSGIYRSTYRRRFADLDPVVNAILREVFTAPVLEAHDWAASDCLASAEWAESLWTAFPRARVIASDTLLCLIEVSCKRQKEAYVFEPDGTPLQYIRPPFVLSLQKAIPRYYPVNRIVGAWAKRGLRQAQQAALQRTPPSAAPASNNPAATGMAKERRAAQAKAQRWNVEEIDLVHPLARRLAAKDIRFEARLHSVFTALAAPGHVIRTMNILNRGYFDESRLRLAVNCVLESLVDGGIWVVGRTREERVPPYNSASIFQKAGRAFKLLRRLNEGSEIEALVLSASAPDQRPTGIAAR
ncbi:MAG TPA: hypothetical protein VKV74_08345 [Bryobacteraceae bacterium]|nr:hypothetical protein [Bryobacteraceae bacterium]